jgi:hypothetical protein
MAIKEKIKKKYAEVDKTLAGGLLPGGAPLSGSNQATPAPVINRNPSTEPTQTNVNAAGYYDKAKGGYVTSDGKLYPTNNQNFVPGQLGEPTNKIIFDKNSVNVNGKQMTRQEYENYNRFSAYDQLVAQRQEALNNQAMAEQAAQTPQITQQDMLEAVPQNTLLDQGTAIGAGAATGIGAGILAGAKAGALLGTAAAPGVGTVIGAVVGVGAGIGAYYTKIGFSKRGDIKQADKVAGIAKTNFGQTIDALNAGYISKDVALERWKEDKISLYAAYANLKKDTSTNLDRFLGGGSDELAKVEDYISDLNNIYENEFALALMQPNPQNIKYSYNRESVEE